MLLTFQDFVRLAVDGKLEKDGTTISFERPVLSEVDINPYGTSGKVIFYLHQEEQKAVN